MYLIVMLQHLQKLVKKQRHLLFMLFTVVSGQEISQLECDAAKYPHMLLADDASGFLFAGVVSGFFMLQLQDIGKNGCYAKSYLFKKIGDGTYCKEEERLKNDPDCKNYIHEIQLIKNNELLICTSNFVDPMYFFVDLKKLSYLGHVEAYGNNIGQCSYGKEKKSTSVYVKKGNPSGQEAYYAGAENEYNSSNFTIYRDLIDNSLPENLISESTIYTDKGWLLSPKFIASFDVTAHVYFFFHEEATEDCKDCPKGTRYSRISRVCKNDEGGQDGSIIPKEQWTTFTKSRIKCPTPELSKENDVLRAVYLTKYNDEIKFHAAFYKTTSQYNGSILCTFSLKNVEKVYNKEAVAFAKKLTLNKNDYPGFCKNNAKIPPNKTFQYIKDNILLKNEISGDNNELIHNAPNVEFTHLVVDRLPDGKSIFTVYFAGTIKGKIYKIVEEQTPNGKTTSTVADVVEVLSAKSVKAMAFSKKYKSLYASSESVIKQLQMEKWCKDRYANCEKCIIDPYCKWDNTKLACEYHSETTARDRTCSNMPGSSPTIDSSTVSKDTKDTDGTVVQPPTIAGMSGTSGQGYLFENIALISFFTFFVITMKFI